LRWNRMKRLIQSEYVLSVERLRCRSRATVLTRSNSLGSLIGVRQGAKKDVELEREGGALYTRRGACEAKKCGFCLPITEFCRMVRLLPLYYGVLPHCAAE
jgi:hypothetical protein